MEICEGRKPELEDEEGHHVELEHRAVEGQDVDREGTCDQAKEIEE